MKTYKINPSKAEAAIRHGMLSRWPLYLCAIGGGISIAVMSGGMDDTGLAPFFIVMPLLALVLYMGYKRAYERSLQLSLSYELQTDGDHFIRKQKNTSPIQLHKDQISEIVEGPEGNIVLVGPDEARTIQIPCLIQDRDDLWDILLDIDKIREAEAEQDNRQAYISYFSIALMALVFILKEPAIVVPGGIILMGLLFWSYNEVQNNPSIDDKTKRLMNWAFVPMGATLIRVIAVAFGLGV